MIPRSASSARVSVKRTSPAVSWAMIPAAATRESVSVDFPARTRNDQQKRVIETVLCPNHHIPTTEDHYLPWSTWAITDMLRMLFFLSMMPRSSSVVNFTCTDISPTIRLPQYQSITQPNHHSSLCLPPYHLGCLLKIPRKSIGCREAILQR